MVQSRGKGVSFMDEEPRQGNVGMVKPVPLASQLLPLIRLALLAALALVAIAARSARRDLPMLISV